MAEHLWFIL